MSIITLIILLYVCVQFTTRNMNLLIFRYSRSLDCQCSTVNVEHQLDFFLIIFFYHYFNL